MLLLNLKDDFKRMLLYTSTARSGYFPFLFTNRTVILVSVIYGQSLQLILGLVVTLGLWPLTLNNPRSTSWLDYRLNRP
jgi:hypothetical protein